MVEDRAPVGKHSDLTSFQLQRTPLVGGMKSRPVESDLERPDAKHIPASDHGALHRPAVDPRPASRFEVAELDDVTGLHDLSVETGHVDVVEDDVVDVAAPDGEPAAGVGDGFDFGHRASETIPRDRLDAPVNGCRWGMFIPR